MGSFSWLQRDLKPQNLLLSTSGPDAVLKIADFGFARALAPQLMADTLCGSPLYMAPEILLSQRYDAKADLWSVGAILYEMLVGTPPYTGANQVALLQAIRRKEARIPWEIEAALSPQCSQLVQALLRRKPEERLAFREFFSHPFLRGSSGDVASPPTSPRGEPPPIVGFEGATGGGAGAVPPPAAVPVGRLSAEFRPQKATGSGLVRPLASYRPRLVSMGPSGVPHGQINPPGSGKGVRVQSTQGMVEDEGFVLVDRVAPQQQQAQAQQPSPSRGPAPQGKPGDKAEGEKAQPAAARGGDAYHTEAFLLGPHHDGVQPSSRPLSPAPPTPGSQSRLLTVPWQAASRRQFLYLVAGILGELGEAVAGGSGAPGRGQQSIAALSLQLSLYLAALQLFDIVFGCVEGAAEGHKDSADVRHSIQSSIGSADSCPADPEQLRADATAVLQRAQATADLLRDLSTSALDAESAGEVSLPNPWAACHSAALRWAAEAAAEELLGNYSQSEGLYAKAGVVLHFLASEAKTLQCEPPPAISTEDEAQLRKCASATAARWSVCATLVYDASRQGAV